MSVLSRLWSYDASRHDRQAVSGQVLAEIPGSICVFPPWYQRVSAQVVTSVHGYDV